MTDISTARRGWPLPAKVAFGGFLAIAAFLLIIEHRAHVVYVVPFLPFAIILACPLMHLFMHHGGGDRAGTGGKETMR